MSKPDDSLDDPYDLPPDGPRGAQRSTQLPSDLTWSRISPLQDQLDEITQRTRSLVPPEKLAPSERATAELFATGIEEQILPVGARAPEFSLPDGSGRMVRSTDLLALGPLVINFFRGRWCSYCVQELEAWQRLHPLVRKQHAILIGISPQTIRQNNFAASQHKLTFPLLSDEGVWVARKFGLDYTVPDSMRRYYRSIMVNVPFMNGEQSWRLPIPATYVIAPDSTVLYARAYADFRVRPEPGETLAAIPAQQ
jgi:peroxiredoxin